MSCLSEAELLEWNKISSDFWIFKGQLSSYIQYDHMIQWYILGSAACDWFLEVDVFE